MVSSSIKIAPSILAADFSRLGQEMSAIEKAGADILHIDVMDGSFVPPITFGANVVATAAKHCSLYREVHLMIVEPARHFESFKDAGAQRLLIHQEVTPHLHRELGELKRIGLSSGVVINPSTPAEHVFPVLELCDVVLVMTVNPGWGGQKFIESCLSKIERIAAEIQKRTLPTLIEVDGGVNTETAKRCVSAGATLLVAGSFVFSHSDRAAAIKSLRQ